MAQTPRVLTDEEILASVEEQCGSARRVRDGRIGRERKTAYEYYFGEPFGNEEEGQSKVISQVVMEVVDSLMPDIMRVFCGGENVVEFVARKAEDVPLAAQATEVANYVLFTQNHGFLKLYEAIKDALLLKTGCFKYWWLEEKKVETETYYGLTEGQLLILHQDPQVELVGANQYPDPSAALMPPPMPQAPAPMPTMGNPAQSPSSGAPSPGQPPPDAASAPPPQPSMLYDVTLKRTKNAGHVCIEAVPPDEILVSGRANTIDTQSLPMIAHETLKTRSELVEMGYDLQTVLELPAGQDTMALTEDAVARLARVDRTFQAADAGTAADPMQQVVRYTECWVLLDADGDGISELLKVCTAPQKILRRETTERVQLAVLTPKIMPHEFYGVSLADDSADLQLVKSTIWRMAMNALYQANFPRTVVVESLAGDNTLNDLLSPMAGKPIRTRAPGAVEPYQVDATAALANSMQMVEFVEQEIEGRTPVSRQYQGLQPDAINKTATGTMILTGRAQARTELICRIFAETGIKELFRGILWLLAKYQLEPLIVRMNGAYVPIDPRAWTTEYDMTINVGLGTGNKQEQLQMLASIAQAQEAAVGAGGMGILVSPEKIYNLQAKVATLAGFKDPEQFWMKPQPGQMPQPPTPPEVQVAQMRIQADAQKAQTDAMVGAAREQAKADAQKQIEAAQMAADTATAKFEAQLEAQLTLIRQGYEQRLKAMETSFDQQTRIRVAELGAMASVQVARINKGLGVGSDMVAALSQDLGIPQAADPLQQLADAITGFTQAVSQPKEIMRDANGRAIGVRPMNGNGATQ